MKDSQRIQSTIIWLLISDPRWGNNPETVDDSSPSVSLFFEKKLHLYSLLQFVAFYCNQ